MEYLDVVNKKDEIIGKALRKECHKDPKLMHRGSNVYIFNSSKLEYIVKIKRSKLVDMDADKWTILIGEHNLLGENYETAIRRGLNEELGVKNIFLKKIGNKIIQKMKYQTEIHQNFIGIYEGNMKSLILDKKEVVEIEFISISDLLKDVAVNKHLYVSYIDNALQIILSHLEKQ